MKGLLWVALLAMLVVVANTVAENNRIEKRRTLVEQASETLSNGSAACRSFKKELSSRMSAEALDGWSSRTGDLASTVIKACK